MDFYGFLGFLADLQNSTDFYKLLQSFILHYGIGLPWILRISRVGVQDFCLVIDPSVPSWESGTMIISNIFCI